MAAPIPTHYHTLSDNQTLYDFRFPIQTHFDPIMKANQIQKITTAFANALRKHCTNESEQPLVQLHANEIQALIGLLSQSLESTSAPVRKRARSAYQIWKSDEQVKRAFRQTHPGSNGPTTNKLMGTQWKALTEDQKQTWLDAAAVEKEQFTAAGGSTKTSKTRKRHRSAYMFFKTQPEVRAAAKATNPTATTKEISALLKSSWENLPAGEKIQYLKMELQDKLLFPTQDPDQSDVAAAPQESPGEMVYQRPAQEAEESKQEESANTVVLLTPSDSISTTIKKARRKGTSPYQRWKKHSDTKALFITRFHNADKATRTKEMKRHWHDIMSDDERTQWIRDHPATPATITADPVVLI